MFENNVSIFVESQFPDNFRNDGELLVKFIEYYYQWLEEEGNVTNVTRKLPDYTDPDKVPDEFFNFLRNEFMSGIPQNLRVDQKLLLKNILSFYRARGTENAYRLLFRILFNVEIKFYYPGDDILRASDGRWTIERYLNVININESIDIALVAEIEGTTSGAKARVERVDEFFDAGAVQYRLYVTNVFGEFLSGENIQLSNTNQFYCTNTSALVVEQGKYIGTYGQLSSNKRLQDNLYYQEYSYEIQSPIDFLKYEGISNDLVHPAGTKLFGKVLSEFDIDGFLQTIDIFIETDLQFGDGILLDMSSYLDGLEDEVIELAFIVDKNRQETAGTGTVSINDGNIADFDAFTIADFGTTPINLIGTKKLIVGYSTAFSAEVGQPNGPLPGEIPVVIKINDTDNSYFGVEYIADKSYSDRFFSLTNDYLYPLVDQEMYNLVRTLSANSITYSDSYANTVLGTGTVVVANTTVTGTGTNFSVVASPGDIIQVNDTVNGNTYAFIYSVNSNTSMTLNDDYKWGSANTSQYKLYIY